MVIGLLRLSPDLQQSYKGNCLECLYVGIYIHNANISERNSVYSKYIAYIYDMYKGFYE